MGSVQMSFTVEATTAESSARIVFLTQFKQIISQQQDGIVSLFVDYLINMSKMKLQLWKHTVGQLHRKNSVVQEKC